LAVISGILVILLLLMIGELKKRSKNEMGKINEFVVSDDVIAKSQ
jgi:hypothetical protein